MPSFLNAFFLGGLSLVAIPLLIHLIRRRKLKVIKWAAMEFLRQSQKKQRRRLRVEELILLALRMLIVAAFVLALARPVLHGLGIPLLSQQTPVYAVIVLDDSLSMGHRGADGKTAFDRARTAVHEVLDHVLKQGDAVSVVLLTDKPTEAVGAPSFDLKLIRSRIDAVVPGDRGTDYYAGAQTTLKLLRASKIAIKEVYWVSDDQAEAWKSSEKDAARATWASLGKLARIVWVSSGAPAADRDNLSIETPVVGRELVTPHLAAHIECRIDNFSTRRRDDLPVRLVIDGKPGVPVRVSISPGGSSMVEFHPLFTQPGIHVGRIELPDPEHIDGLARDNSATFVVRCRERIRILVQDPHPASDPSKSESFYLVTAMAPGGAAESLAPTLKESGELSGTNLRDYDAIAITGLSGLSSRDRSALADYVSAGGGLMLFPGPQTDAARVNSELSALLPAHLGARKSLSDDAAVTLHPDTIPPNHPALSVFRDTSAMNIATARFLSYYPLEIDPAVAASAHVIMRYSNGDPAFVERTVGLGHVILSASTAGASWNQLALKPVFVPLVYQLFSYLGQGATARRNLKMDDTFLLALPLGDANKQVRITDPSGKSFTQSSALSAQGVTFSYGGTTHAGVYRVSVPGSNTADAFSVGLPAAESNLTYADPHGQVRAAGVPADHLILADSVARLRESVNRSRYGSEIWRPLVWLVIALMLIESGLARIWGRRG